MDPDQSAFVESFRQFLDRINRLPASPPRLTPLGEVVERHMGVDVTTVPLVTEDLAPLRLVDADVAMAELSGGVAPLGVTGRHERVKESLPELLSHPWTRYTLPAVDDVRLGGAGRQLPPASGGPR
ncbi:MAG: protease regulatory subunit [Naasia sp.]|jgi:hypothetical protein|uniref:hypothetical protein n=1 Tax=Naasia sp. TaxID=2546198 RepID=UPI002603EFE8|nr:hypothetical protein [Naasia sp.]MCU1569746.1 protease regulatory subunit [Naasia sp.]